MIDLSQITYPMWWGAVIVLLAIVGILFFVINVIVNAFKRKSK